MSEFLQVDVEHALGDLALRVQCSVSAPWTVLFGPSGTGKTSLLRIVAGLITPDQGRVVLKGRMLVDTGTGAWVPPAQRGIGFVTQRPNLFPHINVTENISFGILGFNRESRKQRVGQMLDLFEAGHLAKRMPGELSGGEQQRVALARALAPEPRMLLLDEPFTGLDAELKAEIWPRLTAWLSARQVPALYVSHDIAEIFETGADVLVMDRGQIQAHGAAQMVLGREREELLRRLL